MRSISPSSSTSLSCLGTYPSMDPPVISSGRICGAPDRRPPDSFSLSVTGTLPFRCVELVSPRSTASSRERSGFANIKLFISSTTDDTVPVAAGAASRFARASSRSKIFDPRKLSPRRSHTGSEDSCTRIQSARSAHTSEHHFSTWSCGTMSTLRPRPPGPLPLGPYLNWNPPPGPWFCFRCLRGQSAYPQVSS